MNRVITTLARIIICIVSLGLAPLMLIAVLGYEDFLQWIVGKDSI